jgi:hypothetical protein
MTFLKALFPTGAEAAWETNLLKAIHAVHERDTSPTNVSVIHALREICGDIGQVIADHLEVHATSGLAQLGFADPSVDASFGNKQVTYVKTARLPLPSADTPRSSYSLGEILGSELARLLALRSMRMMEEYRSELKIYNNEEAWQMLRTSDGRAVFDAQQRTGRSELAVPMLATQTTSGIGRSDEEKDNLGNLFGAYFAFRPADADEASRTLRLMGLDSEDAHMIKRLMELESGEALMKDHRGDVEFVDVHLTPSFLAHTSTTPEVEGVSVSA